MKFKPCFSTCLRRIRQISWVAASLFLLTSCQQELAGTDEFAPTVALDYELCNEDGDSVDFPLEILPSEGLDADFIVNIETGTYQSTDCMCEVQTYQLYFTGVNPDCDIFITDKEGNPIDLEIAFDEATGRAIVTILNPEMLLDEDLTALISFDNGEGEADPTLVNAGGLCIIENVVINVGTPLTLEAPFIRNDSSVSPGGGPSRTAFIPTSIGGVPY